MHRIKQRPVMVHCSLSSDMSIHSSLLSTVANDCPDQTKPTHEAMMLMPLGACICIVASFLCAKIKISLSHSPSLLALRCSASLLNWSCVCQITSHPPHIMQLTRWIVSGDNHFPDGRAGQAFSSELRMNLSRQ